MIKDIKINKYFVKFNIVDDHEIEVNIQTSTSDPYSNHSGVIIYLESLLKGDSKNSSITLDPITNLIVFVDNKTNEFVIQITEDSSIIFMNRIPINIQKVILFNMEKKDEIEDINKYYIITGLGSALYPRILNDSDAGQLDYIANNIEIDFSKM